MSAAIQLFLQYLPQLLKAAESIPDIVGYIKRTRDAFAQTKEWTAEEQAAFDRHVEEVTSQPWWAPEA